MRKHFDTNIKTGDIRFNRFSRHPALVVGDKISVYPIVGITHSNKTFGRDNFKITENMYVLPRIDYVSENKIREVYDNQIFSDYEKSNVFHLIDQNRIRSVSNVYLRKIK